jgi:NAD(P)-dependent dehydrogenase (short-subunit alcohol dehydrogenase family)
MDSLAGRVAIVTGAARGIGRGIAAVLRGEGADVVLADIDELAARAAAAELSEDGQHALGLAADVTMQADMARMAAAAIGRWGRIDILAANAGILPADSAG